MVKIKSSETLSLVRGKQKKVTQQVRKLRKKIQEGTISVREEHKTRKIKAEQNRGLIYIAHIPHGFYENEMKNYFKQFGSVTNIKVCRSKKSGNSKGYGYVEFSHPEVAKIAAETMNNYLMFKKRVTAEYVPYEKRPKSLFVGKSSTPARYSTKVRREKQAVANSSIDSPTHLKRSRSRLSNLNKKLQKLKKAGIDCDFKPIDIPGGIKQEKASDSDEITHIYETDPYDSDIEIKVPIKKSVRSIKSSKKGKSAAKLLSEDTSSSGALLTKSLDSVKALLSSKKSSRTPTLRASKVSSPSNKPVSVDVKPKKKTKKPKSKGVVKKSKKQPPLNADTVKKIARELIRKRGNSLLNIISTTKPKSPTKRKAKK